MSSTTAMGTKIVRVVTAPSAIVGWDRSRTRVRGVSQNASICNPAMEAAASQMKGLRDNPSKADRVRERQLKK